MRCAYVALHCVAKALFQGHNMRKRKLKCEREEKVKLKAKNREVNNIVLKADTSLSALLLFRVCSSSVALWLAAWHALACLNRTSKDTAPWRIESWGHELHSYPHKDKPSVSAPLKTDKQSSIEMLWNVEGWGNQMPIDFNASSVRNDFLPHNRWRVEKWVLKPGLWEIKGSRCSAAHVHTHIHTIQRMLYVLLEKDWDPQSHRLREAETNGYVCCFYCTHTRTVTCYFMHTAVKSFIQLKLLTWASVTDWVSAVAKATRCTFLSNWAKLPLKPGKKKKYDNTPAAIHANLMPILTDKEV